MSKKSSQKGKRPASQAKAATQKSAKTAPKNVKKSTSSPKNTPKVKAEQPAKVDKNGKKVLNRTTKTAEITKKIPETSQKRQNVRKIAWLIGVIAALVLAVGAGVGVAILSHQQPEEPEVAETEPAPEPEPEPKPEPEVNEDPLQPQPEINNNNTYQVAAHKPRYLSIPSLGLHNIPVVEIAILPDGTLDKPTSDYVVAWYYRSALPGQPGAVVMDGHGGDLGTGILKTLPRVPIGADIIIEMGDGRKFNYAIEQKVYKHIGNEADSYMDVAYTPMRAGSSTLTLITCTGAWLRNLQTYDQRLFVRAVMH